MASETTGSRIKGCRIKKKLTQGELGALVGVSATAIMRYEQGEREPKVQTFRAIAKALDVSEEYLLLLTDNPMPIYDFQHVAFEAAFDEHFLSSGHSVTSPFLAYRDCSSGEIVADWAKNKDLYESKIDESEKHLLEVVTEVCSDLSPKDDLAKKISERTWLPYRINQVAEFISTNSAFLRKSMPGMRAEPSSGESEKSE